MNEVIETTVMLFFNLANRVYYIKIGDCLVPMKEKLATQLKERLQLEIIKADDIKDMQLICNKMTGQG